MQLSSVFLLQVAVTRRFVLTCGYFSAQPSGALLHGLTQKIESAVSDRSSGTRGLKSGGARHFWPCTTLFHSPFIFLPSLSSHRIWTTSLCCPIRVGNIPTRWALLIFLRQFWTCQYVGTSVWPINAICPTPPANTDKLPSLERWQSPGPTRIWCPPFFRAWPWRT